MFFLLLTARSHCHPNMAIMKLLSTTAAARRADCSPDTIRRACQKGELVGRLVDGKRGPAWKITPDDLEHWIALREEERRLRLEMADYGTLSDEDSLDDRRQEPSQQHSNTGAQECRNADRRPLDSSSAAGQDQVPASVHLALVEELRRADRQVLALQYQLGQEQRLLSEHAESILEREALAKQAQAQKEIVEEEVQFARAETAKIAEQLKEARAELAKWEEQRSQPWWKRMFKTS